jgi:hypothetical protein
MAHASVTWRMLCGACAPIEESLAISYEIAQLRDIKTSLNGVAVGVTDYAAMEG